MTAVVSKLLIVGTYLRDVIRRDCNPGLSIPGFGIVEFPIPGSRRDWCSV